MHVAFFCRRPSASRTYSIEQMFDAVRSHLPSDISSSVVVPRFTSIGVWRRLYNLAQAAWRRGRADVNHITGDIHYVALLMSKRSTVLTVHDCGFETHSNRWRRMVIRTLWLRLPVRRVAVVATDSEFSRQRIIALSSIDPDKVVVIPACSSDEFRPIERAFNWQYPTILHVGTTVNKNLDRVCQALRDIPCRLVVVGVLSDSQRRALSASSLNWTNFHGLTERELASVYGESDLVLFASTYEGFGLPIVEAQRVGRPVITSNVASMPDVAGQGACLVDPYDVESIRAGVKRVIEDASYRRELIERGFENAIRFGPEVTAQGYIALYRAVLEGRYR